MYKDILASLPADAALARHQPSVVEIEQVASMLGGRSLLAVGSGGTVALAEFAAYAHRQATERPAWALTPLMFLQLRSLPKEGVLVVFSARAKHPDTARVIERAGLEGIPTLLVTEKLSTEIIPALPEASLQVLTVPRGESEDGFLATSSVVRMAITVARLYRCRTESPSFASQPAVRDRLLVLYGAEGLPAARDIETRMHELGLAAVQLSDFRNFAHGRHVGLNRRMHETTVITLGGRDSREICERTIARLPAGTHVVSISTDRAGVDAALELLAQVVSLPSDLAAVVPLDPSRPSVPPFGRALYHLPYKRALPRRVVSPVDSKLRAAGLSFDQHEVARHFSSAYAEWRRAMMQQQFVGLLLDYDGTCVATKDRWGPPTVKMQESLIRLLRFGARLAIASGRGDSLYGSLRNWVPSDLWGKVDLGLHNGTWFQKLAEDLASPPAVSQIIIDAVDRIRALERWGVASIRTSRLQISLQPTTLTQSVSDLRTLASSLLTPDLRNVLAIRTSGHSVDIFPGDGGGKVALLEHVQAAYGTYLVIGDQGAPNGNDYDLLHATPYSVTVGATSPDPSRCWPVYDARLREAAALGRLIDSLGNTETGLRFVPPIAKVMHGTASSPASK